MRPTYMSSELTNIGNTYVDEIESKLLQINSLSGWHQQVLFASRTLRV